MIAKTNTKIFIASSFELREDRRAFREIIMEQNNAWHEHGAFLQVVGWEHFFDVISPTRLQDEYNKAIQDCDIFVMLFRSKVGKYTREEFEVALSQFIDAKKPLIYVYYTPSDPDFATSDEDQKSLADFRKRLSDIGHFETRYENLQDLQLKFLQQVHRLAELGHIHFAPAGGALPSCTNPLELTHVSIGVQARLDATIETSPNAVVVGEHGVQISDNHARDINASTIIKTGGGSYVGGSVSVGSGGFVGRDSKHGGTNEA